MKVVADYQKSIDNGKSKVVCHLCPHTCEIESGKTGLCGVRKNIEGKLYSINYAEVTSAGIDPIEKKPLYHFHPRSKILSLGTFGCNFSCDFCQNWQISQEKANTRKIKPKEVIEMAQEKEVKSIAYTYSEPMVWYEFVRETSKLAHKAGLKNVLVTNGYINPEPLEKILPHIDGTNVDLKSFSDDFYREFTGGSLQPVKNIIKKLNERTHLEVTTLIINEMNDNIDELKKLFSWLGKLNKSIPLHLSRYFPAYKMNKPATEITTMEKAYHTARNHLDFVYLGNMKSKRKNNTNCPECGKELIRRSYFQVESELESSDCPVCGHEIYGLFSEEKEQG